MKAERHFAKADVGSSHHKASQVRTGRGDWESLLVPALLIVLVTLWIYAPAMRGEWLWDDKELISHNEIIHDPQGLWRIWSDPDSLIDYYPMLSSVVWIEWHLFHEATFGYHVVNVGLHVLSAFLVWRLLAKFGLRLAWLGGLVFTIHPVQVESVAWIAELKNTLSLPFFLLAMCAYIDFDERGRRRDYVLALGLFIIAMLCKTTMAMFPVVILLYVWWKHGRIRGADLKVSAAFFAVSLVLGWVTVWFQQHHAIRGNEIVVGGLASHLALAGSSLGFYLWHSMCPQNLLPIYPKWAVDPPATVDFVPWVALVIILAISWLRRATWGRHVLLGLGFFLLNLVPFVGVTTAYYLSFSWVLDHVLYIPLIGLAGLFVAWIELLWVRFDAQSRIGVVGLVAVCLAMLSLRSHLYAGEFTSQHTLWTYTLERNPNAWPAQVNLGNYLLGLGRVDEAMELFKRAIRLNPQLANAHNSLGNAYQDLGHYSEAIGEYQLAMNISPSYEAAHQGMGLALARTGNISEAIEQYKIAVAIDPKDTKTRLEFADLLLKAGRASEAAEQYETVLRNDPHYTSYRDDLEKASPGKN